MENTSIRTLDASDAQDHAEHANQLLNVLLAQPTDSSLTLLVSVCPSVVMDSSWDLKLVTQETNTQLAASTARSKRDTLAQVSLQSADPQPPSNLHPSPLLLLP